MASTGLVGLELGLLPLLVQLAVLVGDLEYLSQVLGWDEHGLVTGRRIFLRSRLRVLSLLERRLFGEKVQLQINELEMAQVLGTTLPIQVHICDVVVVVAACSLLHLELVTGSSVLECVEDMQAVVLVEFEGFADFLRARIFAVVVSKLRFIVFLGRRFAEEVKVEVLVHEDSLIQSIVIVCVILSVLDVKGIDFRSEVLNRLSCLAI